MATILVTILFLKSRYARQQAIADDRIVAIAAADALLSIWWQDIQQFPRNASGVVPSHPDLIWQTRPLRNPAVERLGCVVIRLQIEETKSAITDAVSVDIMLPAESERHE